MNIAITGINGFVGKNLTEYFDQFSYNYYSIDIRKEINKDILKNATTVIHLAGKAHDLKNTSNPQEYYDVNFELTKKVYDAFLLSDARKFIFISSIKAVADQTTGVLTEQSVANPQTHYGKSKLLAEEYIQSQALSPEKLVYILRPCMIHGPGNKGNLNLLHKFTQKGIPYPLAAFTNQRSLLSVYNLCFIINELITSGNVPSGTYNLADDEAISTNDIISIFAQALNSKPKFWKLSPKLIKFIAKVGDMINLPLTTERLNKLTGSYIVSNENIKKAMGKELPLSAVEGLKITADSFNKD